MILLINVFITDKHLTKYDRGFLPSFDRLDIFKYTLASYAAINRWSKIIIYVKLDFMYLHRSLELARYIYKVFTGNYPIEVNFFKRCEYQKQWIALAERLEAEEDQLIWYACNDDHVFIASDYIALDNALEALINDPNPKKAIYYSHWIEPYRRAKKMSVEAGWEFNMLENGTIRTQWNAKDSIQIVSAPLFKEWWTRINYGTRYVPRSDWRDIWKIEPFRCYIPAQEICKHFDGYSHLFSAREVPPLTIPEGFFKNAIDIHYLAPERTNNEVFINPEIENYRSADPRGVDSKGLLSDIPLFWQGRIKNVRIFKEETEEIINKRNNAKRAYILAHTDHPDFRDYLPGDSWIRHSLK